MMNAYILFGDKMVNVNITEKPSKYSFWTGLKKTLKNMLVLFGPSILAFLANVPAEYAWLAGGVAYMFKNWLENRKN